jgi:hypothetical protein
LEKSFNSASDGGYAKNVFGASDSSEIRARFDLCFAQLKDFFDCIDDDSDEVGSSCRSAELQDDDTGPISCGSKGHGELGSEVEYRNDCSTQVDHPADVVGHIGDGGDWAKANDFADMKDRKSVGLLPKGKG